MKKIKKRYSYLLLFTMCIITAFSFLKSSAVSSQKNEVRTNPNKEYQITYELNGGRFEGEYPKTFKISQETSIPNPIKDGSEFLGWTINDKTDAKPVKDYKIPSMTKEDVKLTANWKSKGNTLVDGRTFNSTILGMSGFTNVEEIRFVKGTPNSNGTDVSLAQDKSIMAHINGIVLTIASEEEIMANPDCRLMFYNFGYLYGTNKIINKIVFNNFKTSKVTSMQDMFNNCYLLTDISGLENFNTSKVTDMSHMFYRCYNLSGEIAISNPNITSYESMFNECSTDPSAKFIVKYVSPETKEVARQMVETKKSGTRIGNVFLYEEPNTLVDGITFNKKIKSLSNIKNIDKIVFNYEIPNNIPAYIADVSQNQDKSIIVYMDKISYSTLYIASNGEIIANPNSSKMFDNLTSLKILDFNNFNTSQVINMDCMFSWCSSLTSLDVSNWDTSKVTNMHNMFFNCYALQTLNISNWDTSKVTNMSYMFESCSQLREINGLEKLDTSKVTNMSYMFNNCKNLSGKITIMNPNIKNYLSMFYDCSQDSSGKFIVKYIDKATKEVARQMVETKGYGNVFLYEPPILVNGQTFNNMVSGINGFKNVEEIRFIYGTPNPYGTDVSEAQDKSIMAYISGVTLTVACEDEMFANSNCYQMFLKFGGNDRYSPNMVLKKITFENFNTSQVITMENMFYGCCELTNIDVSNWDTNQVTDMSGIFDNCYSLMSLDLSGFDTSKVTDMNGMFWGCNSLTEIKGIERWNTSQVTNMANMFNICGKLTKLNLSSWNIIKVTDMRFMFEDCNNLSGEITISNPNTLSYTSMFKDCSSVLNTRFVVNYTSGCRNLAQNMVFTANSGNVVLGTQKSLLNEDIPNNEKPSVPDTVVLTIKDGNKTTIKEILAGEIGSLNTPSKEGMIFSGYFYDAEFTKPVSERDIISEDTTIYIKWEEAPQEETPQVEEIPQEENKDESFGEVA